jgi:uncharacterized protein (DUF362 family)
MEVIVVKKGRTMHFSRRDFVQLAGATALLPARFLKAQTAYAPEMLGTSNAVAPAKVALVKGENRRKNIYEALVSIDDQIRAKLNGKKRVVIKPNCVSDSFQLAASHADALNGILDYLEPRFRGPVVIAESSAGDSMQAFEHFKYNQIASERKSQKVSLIDLNRDAKYEVISVLDNDMHPVPVRLAAALVDPDVFIISAAMLKTHNAVVATMSTKNMVLGAPLHSPELRGGWSDKRKYHFSVRHTHYNMLLTAQKMQPRWGLAVIDGFEGMEGKGPAWGTPVQSQIAIASTDLIAADRVGLEAMGINPEWVGYLRYCAQFGLGQYDLSKINIVGPSIASVAKKYQLHPDIQKELQWMEPLQKTSPTLGLLPIPFTIDRA